MNTRPLSLFAALAALTPLGAQSEALGPAPAHYVVPPGWEPHVVAVKFRDGLAVRLRDGVLVDLAGVGALDRAEPVLERMRAGRWSRTHRLPEEVLDRMRSLGERNTSGPLPDPNLQFRCELPADVDAAAVIDALNALDCVELAESIPGWAPLPQTPDYRARQGYCEAAPRGTGAASFQGFPNAIQYTTPVAATGGNARIADIEYDFDPLHADLPPITVLTAPGYAVPGDAEHGTAVLGELFARNDGVGTTGIAHGAQAWFAHARTAPDPQNPQGLYDVPNAISMAANALGPGGVILIEQQIAGPRWNQQATSQIGLMPVEWDVPTWGAIELAVAMGVVVVEAAGNGSQNLDDPIYQRTTLRYSGPWFAAGHDSGALLVGAGAAPGGAGTPRARLAASAWGSNYGETLDLQGWGERIVTTGYGDLYSAIGGHMTYTQQFGGTSGASPIVAGACALLQSLHQDRFGAPLSPDVLRSALRRSGTPQAGFPFVADPIGPLPDLSRAALDLHLYRGLELAQGFESPLPGQGGNGLTGPGGATGPGAFVEFDDDGPGPNPPCLYAAGSFTTAGGVPVNNIARWNGVGWSALGGGITGPNVWVSALAVYDADGPGPQPAQLYAAGYFDQAGGVPARGIARWNGSSWSAVGSGLAPGGVLTSNSIHALCVVDEDGAGPLPPSLIAAGEFPSLGGVFAPRIARWRNNAWSAIGPGFDATVEALEVYDPDDTGPLPARLIAAGFFTHTGAGLQTRCLASWDGASWSEFGGGVQTAQHIAWSLQAVTLVRGQQQALFVGGAFFDLGGLHCPNQGFGVWNGAGWFFPPLPLMAFTPRHFGVVDNGESSGQPWLPEVFLTDGNSGALLRMELSTWTTATVLAPTGVYAFATFDEDGDGGLPPSLFLGGSTFDRLLSMSPFSPTAVLGMQPTGCGDPYRPTIGTTGQPVLGEPLTVQFDCLPHSLPVLLVGGPEPMPPLLCSGQSSCALGVQPVLYIPGTSATFQVPRDPWLVGGTVAFQGMEVQALPYGSYCSAPYLPFALRATDTVVATF